MNGGTPRAEIEVRHLRVLVALAEEGTFTDAAIRLGLGQPAVSRALAALEAALGVHLVRRTTRSLDLTDAGRACYDAAVTALRAIDAVRDAALGHVRPLRLGYSWAAFGRYTTTVLRTWRDEHPDVPLEVHRIDERDAGLLTGAVDVTVRRDDPRGPGLRIEPIFREGRMAAVPAGSDLARRSSLTLADLSGEAIALSPFGTTRLELWPAPIRPTRVVDVTNTDEWLVAIAAGEAVGVTPESTPAQHSHPGVRFVPLTGFTGGDTGITPEITVSLVWRADRPHPAVTAFVDLVRRCVSGSFSQDDPGAGSS
jgi:DNA-binding transcriptional LysR family regulator